MARIGAGEMSVIEDAFGNTSGYVADFTNATFNSFFNREVGVHIYADEYGELGGSKGKRLRCFLEKAPDDLAVQALRALWSYVKQRGWKPDWQSSTERERVVGRFEALLQRLSGPREPAGPSDLAWLARVQKRLREIQHVAFRAFDDANESDDKSVPEGVKEALSAHYEILKEQIPEDFPSSAMGDLARHIRFIDLSDMRSIAGWDVPDIMAKAERYALENRDAAGETEAELDFRNIVHEVFRAKLGETLASPDPDYHALVLNCSVILADRFRGKTGMADEMRSITKAFSLENPILKVGGTGPDAANYQQGAMFLFQGYRTFFRNTHAHGVTATDRDLAFHALALFSLLMDILVSAEVVATE